MRRIGLIAFALLLSEGTEYRHRCCFVSILTHIKACPLDRFTHQDQAVRFNAHRLIL